jgi:hypothetical protein
MAIEQDPNADPKLPGNCSSVPAFRGAFGHRLEDSTGEYGDKSHSLKLICRGRSVGLTLETPVVRQSNRHGTWSLSM